MIVSFLLAKIDPEKLINNLRKNVQNIQSELDQLGNPVSDMPELINSANLIRSNEYLIKVNDKKTELLSAYVQYSLAMEELLRTAFDIQNDLKEILRDQSSIISKTKKRSKTKSKSRISKK